MKPTLLAFAFSVLCVLTSAADEEANPLDQHVPGGWKYDSFNAAVQQMEEKTGFKVTCWPALQTFMQTVWLKASHPEDASDNTTAKTLLDQLAGQMNLRWAFDPVRKVVTLDLPWKTADPRSPAELLKAVWQPGYGADYQKDPKWQTAFNALLSKDVNFEKAWRVRQKASLQRILRFFGPDSVKPILMKQVVARSGVKYILVLACQDIEMYPGNGSASYYWFKDDGTMFGAGLMNTGHRCKVVDTTIDNELGAHTADTSELQMILKMNERDLFVATFVLDDGGLELTHLTDVHAKEVNNNGLSVGKSLMEPDAK